MNPPLPPGRFGADLPARRSLRHVRRRIPPPRPPPNPPPPAPPGPPPPGPPGAPGMPPGWPSTPAPGKPTGPCIPSTGPRSPKSSWPVCNPLLSDPFTRNASLAFADGACARGVWRRRTRQSGPIRFLSFPPWRGSLRPVAAGDAAARTLSALSAGEAATRATTRWAGLREPWADLDLLASSLEPEHLDFHRVGSRRKTGEFVRAGFVGGGHRPVIALSGNYCGSRQWLAAELDDSRGCEALVCACERRTKSRSTNKTGALAKGSHFHA